MAAALALLTAFALAGCGGDGDGQVQPSELVQNPDAYRGERVTFGGAVSNPIDHRVWEMADGRLFVIYDRGLDSALQEGEQLRVTGAVRQFDQETIEGELGVDIEDHFFTDDFLSDDVAFVAEGVRRLDGQ